ncbi:Putative cytoplasmic protein [Enterobacter cancerogenus]|uniref:Cytoplasmic protein n=1 Tax=Enterobacter cancerogenus TaxID=69218 RepID=A0A484X645_9ENTR|nr:Putative cytoplasmic protein [Enterobacter cancerogenus]
MRALLQPVIARELGIVLLKPGRELMSLFTAGRVLIEHQPESMAGYQTGRIPDGPATSGLKASNYGASF